MCAVRVSTGLFHCYSLEGSTARPDGLSSSLARVFWCVSMMFLEMVRGGLSAAVLGLVLLSATVTVTTAQQRFQFCGGPGLIHAVIRVCSRSLPDELVPPPGERPTTTGIGAFKITSHLISYRSSHSGLDSSERTKCTVIPTDSLQPRELGRELLNEIRLDEGRGDVSEVKASQDCAAV